MNFTLHEWQNRMNMCQTECWMKWGGDSDGQSSREKGQVGDNGCASKKPRSL